MPYKRFNREGFIYLNNLSIKNPLFQLVDLVKMCDPYLSRDIKDLILKREKQGDTFIGQKTIILHVTTVKLKSEFCLYVYSSRAVEWQSLATGNKYVVDKFIILGIDPSLENHPFKHLKTILRTPKQLEQISEDHQIHQLNTINWF